MKGSNFGISSTRKRNFSLSMRHEILKFARVQKSTLLPYLNRLLEELMLKWQYSEECMCRLQNIAMRDYRTDKQTDRHMDRKTPDKVIPMCHYASQATQKLDRHISFVFGTHGQTDARQSDPYVLLCFTGDTKIRRTYMLNVFGKYYTFNFNMYQNAKLTLSRIHICMHALTHSGMYSHTHYSLIYFAAE